MFVLEKVGSSGMYYAEKEIDEEVVKLLGGNLPDLFFKLGEFVEIEEVEYLVMSCQLSTNERGAYRETAVLCPT